MTQPWQGPPVRSAARDRLAMVIALAAAPAMVIAGLGATWLAGGDPVDPPEELPAPVVVADPLPAEAPVEIPEGDYEAFCVRLAETVALLDTDAGDLTAQRLVGILRDVEFPRLLEVAPLGLRPAVEDVRDGVEELEAALIEAGADGRVDPGDLSQEFRDGLAVVAAVAGQVCNATG